MEKKIVNVAIIGMGKMGKLRYEVMKRNKGFSINAICDTNINNMKGYGERKYTDWKACIDNEDVDALMVCTFNDIISQIVCYALERNIYVFSEKPPGRTLNDALEMQKSDINSKACLKFGFNHRYHNAIIEAKALVESGLLGDIVCIRGVYGKAGNPNFVNEWRNDTRLSGGGILLDQGIHMLDLICYFLGDVKLVNSIVNNLVWKDMSTEDSALAILETEDGKVASLHSSAIQWKHKFDLDIICENGYIEIDGILTASESYGEERVKYYKKDLAAISGKLGRPLEHTLCFDSDESWDYEIAEFYDIITNSHDVKQGTSYEAVRLMKLIDEIYKENGIKVK